MFRTSTSLPASAVPQEGQVARKLKLTYGLASVPRAGMAIESAVMLRL